MKNEHDVRYDLDSLLVLSIMTPGEKKLLTRDFDTKLKERISDKTRNPKKQDFENSNVIEIKDNEDDQIEISSLEDEGTDEINSKEEDQKLPPPADDTKDKVFREGVLKCKLCPRYIKQSQMIIHKEQVHNKASIKDNPENCDKLLIEERKNVDVELDQNIVSKKRTLPSSSVNVDNVPKKSKAESRSSEEEDEEWTAPPRSKRRVRISCRYCSKKFGSKLSVTAHERKVHTENGF